MIRRLGLPALLALAVFMLTGCGIPSPREAATLASPMQALTETPSATPAASPAGTPDPAGVANTCQVCGRQAATLTAQAQAETTETAALTCPPGEAVCDLKGHFYFKRPIPPLGNLAVERTYRYGSTQEGAREPHHGVELVNPQGTPVLAAADGIVVFAGNDKSTSLAWVPNFYGNVVVIRHQFNGVAQPVFTLYAHLYSIGVKAGQSVGAGEQVGEVGATGTAIGAHLHFEVRLGKNDYRSNRNPDLWLAPLPGTGVLAGRLENSTGQVVNGLVNVQKIEQGQLIAAPVAGLETYSSAESQPVNPDDLLGENFAIGELPAGEYRLSLVYNGLVYEQAVSVKAGRLTFVRFKVK